jgi:P pilus assembly chaperone PapD
MYLTSVQRVFRKSLFKVAAGFAAALLLALLAGSMHASAQGNLLISPRRIVFEGSRRTAELNLANTGTDTARYVMSLMEIRMKEDGSFEIIEAADSVESSFATPYIRFFPRSVVLAPNEAQTVKMQVVRASELNVGEYRSHLYFRAISDPKPLGDDSNKEKDSTVTVSLKPTFGISIPVIIRVGENNTQASLSDLAFTAEGGPGIRLVLNRTGNMSVYGNLQVAHISENGTVTNVGIAKGLAVYTCIDRRHFSLPLDKSANVDYRKGTLRFTYTEDVSNGALLAEGSLNLNN